MNNSIRTYRQNWFVGISNNAASTLMPKSEGYCFDFKNQRWNISQLDKC